MTEARTRGQTAARAPRRRRLLTLGLTVIAGLAAIALAAPYASVAFGARRAEACLERFQAVRPPSERPDCGPEMRWFITPSRILWTRETASYRGEELYARIAVATYLDAAVGWPDKTVLAQAAEGLSGAEKVVKEGSQRVSMEDLGRSVGSPSLGRAAVLVGDRAALLGRFEGWEDWYVRLHTLRAALTEGDLPLALRTAKRYAEFDPRDEDLRIGVAALLCLGEDAKRGLELMTSAQDDRATRRYAAMARDWGDVRLLIVACAARAGLTPPPRPEAPEAGQGDKLEARAALRLRLIAAEEPGAGATPSEGAAGGGSRSMPGDGPNSVADRDRQAVTWAAELLAAGVSDPKARLALLALVVGSPYPPSPAQTVHLVPRLDEPPLARPEAMTALDWLIEARGLRPIAPAPAIKRAAERLLEMAGSAGLDAPSAAALRAAAGALWMEAGKTLALAGEVDQALAAFDRGSSEAQWSKPTLALARSSARAMAGNIDAALAEIDALSPEFRAPPPSDKPGTSTETAVLAALLLQRAELLAMAPPHADEPSRATRKKLLAQAALDADGAASASKIGKLDARARWMRLAFVRAPDGSPLRPGTEIDAAQMIPPRTWPWVGEIPAQENHPSQPSLGSSGAPLLAGESSLDRRWEGPLARSLAAWNAAIAAPPPERLALRYALLSVRGDVVPAPLAYLSLATELLAGQGGAEVWLDVVMAPSSRSISHRMFAWTRWQAALRRGDLERATEWRRRFETLRAIASDPARAEIAAFLGI